jgi:hypothetical protein
MTPVVEGRESAYHHQEWTSRALQSNTLQELGEAQELSRELDQVQGAAHSTSYCRTHNNHQVLH